MPKKKHETPAHIGLSTSMEFKEKFDRLCLALELNRGELFELIFVEWRKSKKIK